MAELTGVLADKGGLHAQRLVLDSVQVDGAALGGRLDERVHGHRQLESLGEDQARFARCPLAVPPVPQQARQALWPQHSTYATCQPFFAHSCSPSNQSYFVPRWSLQQSGRTWSWQLTPNATTTQGYYIAATLASSPMTRILCNLLCAATLPKT
jgi:hypothetical protein